MPWLDQVTMENKSDSPSRTIRLMIREARESTKGLDPNNIFTHAGVKMPHPEPYSGEADLEKFEVFVCEGDTEMRPLVYRDSLRQGRAE